MKSRKDINIWDPNEIVYKAGDKSISAYLVLDGSAEIIFKINKKKYICGNKQK